MFSREEDTDDGRAIMTSVKDTLLRGLSEDDITNRSVLHSSATWITLFNVDFVKQNCYFTYVCQHRWAVQVVSPPLGQSPLSSFLVVLSPRGDTRGPSVVFEAVDVPCMCSK